jgi:hypothetical protein
MLVEVTLSGSTARIIPDASAANRWTGEVFNEAGLGRAVIYHHAREMRDSSAVITGAPESPFTRMLGFRLWSQVAATEPEAQFWFRATRTEIVRPGVVAMGRQYAHWFAYSIVPQPEPEQLEQLVRDLESVDLRAKAVIQQGLGAVLAVRPDENDLDRADISVTVLVEGMQRRSRS